MNVLKYVIYCVFGLSCFSFKNAQAKEKPLIRKAGERIGYHDTIDRKGFTLVFIDRSVNFSDTTKQKMIDVFFKTYPEQVAMYNPDSRKKVVLIIDSAYKGVAAAGGGTIRVNPEWMKKNPEDIDVVTHEAMHIVQSYPPGAGPGWITEGVADYVRYTMGVNNEAGNWSLPAYKESHHYTNAYRVTARFFVWLEKNTKNDLIQKLDKAMRTRSYTSSFWTAETGKTIDELWTAYGANPSL